MRIYVWDPAVRVFHWALVIAFAANALFTNPEAQTHRWVGYVVATLIGLRLVWGGIGSRHARFADFRPSPSAAINQLADMVTGRKIPHAGHSPLGALMIYNMLMAMAAIATTGYMMTTVAYFGVDWVEEAHELLVTWAEISVCAHVVAVVTESRRLRVNLPAAMITGYKYFHTDVAKSEREAE